MERPETPDARWGVVGEHLILLPALTVGLGTSVAMWLIGFLTHLPAFRSPPVVTGLLLFGALALGGAAAGRLVARRSAFGVGAISGGITSVVNLLVVGAVVASEQDHGAVRQDWAIIVAGSILFGAVVGAVSAFVSTRLSRGEAPPDDAHSWLFRFGLVAAAAAVPVLLSGGLVTSTNAGLAVPDWPTSFSANMFLFPLSKMTGGIYYEHSHRLFGSLVGLTTLALLIAILVVEDRRWVKGAAGAAFLAVCAQGVLGGARVTAATGGDAAGAEISDHAGSLALAMIHGISAQLIFALLCVLAAFLSPSWRSAAAPHDASPDRWLRLLTRLLLAAVVLQLVLGSATRHFQHAHAMFTHIGFALVVTALAALAAFRAISRHREQPIIRRLGHASLHTLLLQLALGVVALVGVLPYEPGKTDPIWVVTVATAHQGIGALLLALAALLAAWSQRYFSCARAS